MGKTLTEIFGHWQQHDVDQFNARTAKQSMGDQRPVQQQVEGGATPDPIPRQTEGVTQEVRDLHLPIIAWCQGQVPAVPYYHARTDKPSTISEGAPDFCLFYRGRCILVECKTRTGKLSEAQRDWSHLAQLQGFPVSIVRSMDEFRELVEA